MSAAFGQTAIEHALAGAPPVETPMRAASAIVGEAESAPVYAMPDEQSRVVGQLARGKSARITSSAGAFLAIEFEGKRGYVRRQDVASAVDSIPAAQQKAWDDRFAAAARAIDAAFETHDRVMIESLGAGAGFERFHAALAQAYAIKLIRVVADLDTYLRRVRQRSSAGHIAVSDDKVAEYNRIAAQVRYDWALEIDNSALAPDDVILASIRRL